ncbi:MAG: 16S rRNA (guanine(966)-N(2))-methyltransferase RsmD [Clostridiales bacterium]|nr:16S rRNA (guanine(966)-N(2))-methyltransferase RsmD [Clostridiales bacterium]
MRVITGSAKGRRLKTLEGEDIRPTADKVKGAIFSSIQFDIEGRKVLDLFAGSGQLGIEALSRGAERAVFVDLSRDAVKVVNENLTHCLLSEKAYVFNGDGISYLKTAREKFDIVFLDPPYKKKLVTKALPLAAASVNEGGIIVCETGLDEELPETVGDFTAVKQKRYSKTMLTVYRQQ